MKKWLEMFASWILESTTDLYKYLKENNIKSNSPKNPITLHQSIIYRLLEEKRLYFYGWYILKPDYWISQPIESKHQAMINDYTMYKILEKLNLNKRPAQERETAVDEHYPLRGIIRCKECGSKFTARKSKSKGWKYFYYYWCRNPKCNFWKKSVPISKIHFEYLEIVNKISPKDNILQMAEVIFENAFNLEKEQGSAQKKSIESKLKSIKSELSNIENVLINIKQPELIKKYENKWEALNIEKRSLEEESKSDFYCEDNYKALFDWLLNVIKNPNSIWNLGNVELIQLFSRVRFDWPITYDWNEWLRTPWNSNLNLLFRPLEWGEFP